MLYEEERRSLYAADSHKVRYWFSDGLFYHVEPHTLWLVTDEDVKTSIYGLCAEIDSYREQSPIEVPLGTPRAEEVLLSIRMVTHSFGYTLDIINWDRGIYNQSVVTIKGELFGSPAFHFSRYELSPDADDSVGIQIWYSTIEQEYMDKLLTLLYGIDASNSQPYAALGTQQHFSQGV